MKDLWPFGVALRGEASNHLMLRWLKTVVVSDEEKAHRMRQVGIRKASESEPLMTCRNESQWRRNRGKTWAPGQVRGEPADCPDGVRHVGGASLARALAWNVRTCRPDTVAGPVGRRREGDPQAVHAARG